MYRARIAHRLRLAPRDAWIGGVCAGLARYLGTDASFVRIGAVLAALLGSFGMAALVYIVAWCCMPEPRRYCDRC